MAHEPRLIIQVPRGGAVDRQLRDRPLDGIAGGEIVVEVGPTDSRGHLEPPAAGKIVLSVPAPEALEREAGDVRRVIAHAGTGVEALVVVIEAAEELTDAELAVVLAAARHSSRPVILRIIRDA
ncbi:MAG: hypothetical protein ACLP50_22050 [Solirubrobacteraceae bacterium]